MLKSSVFNMRFASLFWPFLLLLVSCSTTGIRSQLTADEAKLYDHWHNNKRDLAMPGLYHLLKSGESKKKIRQLLGEPDDKSSFGNDESWTYRWTGVDVIKSDEEKTFRIKKKNCRLVINFKNNQLFTKDRQGF